MSPSGCGAEDLILRRQDVGGRHEWGDCATPADRGQVVGGVRAPVHVDVVTVAVQDLKRLSLQERVTDVETGNEKKAKSELKTKGKQIVHIFSFFL